MNRIKLLRQQFNIGQKTLASEIGVSQPTISDWEKGNTSPNSENAIKLANLFGVSVDYLMGHTARNYEHAKGRGIKIPVLGHVPAGLPIEAVEEILDYEEITPELAQRGEFFALKIRGDSMEPLIMDSDVVIVHQQPDANSGDICILCVNGYDATCKRIQKMDNGILVIPQNPSHNAVFFDNNSKDKLTILGIVIEVRRKLNNRF